LRQPAGSRRRVFLCIWPDEARQIVYTALFSGIADLLSNIPISTNEDVLLIGADDERLSNFLLDGRTGVMAARQYPGLRS
jgi:hypothetical protein